MPPSFLFIVNELPTNDDPDRDGCVQPRYVDGRWLPPVVAEGFLPQSPGDVYRWTAGSTSIRLAEAYSWTERPQYSEDILYARGTIRAESTTGPVYPQYFRAATVFYCNHFAKFYSAEGDASTRNNTEPETRFYPLSFLHENDNVSYVQHTGSQEYLAVRDASWIEELLPRTYRRHTRTGPDDGGLSGLLPIIIGLVAFSCRRNDLYRVLIEDRAWRGRRWVPHRRETGRIERRGVVVTVYLDPENPESTTQAIWDLETSPTPIFR